MKSWHFTSCAFPPASRSARPAARSGAPRSSCSAPAPRSATAAGPNSKRSYNAGYGIKGVDDLHAAIQFFEERRGRLHGFRWKDWSDYKSCAPAATPSPTDQALGTGDGVTPSFQLVKIYGSGFAPWTRTILKPVAGAVAVAVAGVTANPTNYAVDTTTGIVTFVMGHIPTMGQAVTAGFEFDVPVRFDTDQLEINLAQIEAGSIPHIPIVEIRP